MIKVTQVVNDIFNSNTFIISHDNHEYVWLIDAGNINGITNYLPNNQTIKGAFITHPHFDHIYGINELIRKFPECKIYASAMTRDGLYSAKLNLSFYHDSPIEFEGENVAILEEGDAVKIFNNCFIEIMETPGHYGGCLTFKMNDYLFTGDSFIPGHDVVTKLKGGNKEAARQSLTRIKNASSETTIICPGHGETKRLSKLKNNNI